MNNKIIYLHTLLNDTPFYVGKGTIDRAYSEASRSKLWGETVWKEGGYLVEILETGLSNDAANEREKFYIKKYRELHPETMINIADGGDAEPLIKVGLLYTDDNKFLILQNKNEVVRHGFSYSSFRYVCTGRQFTTASDLYKVNGRRVRFNGCHFQNIDECLKFIDDRSMVPYNGNLVKF